MSRQINQPINQVRLTNVAVVRMSKGGKRFEIACYRNKVVDYRQGLEQDLGEVLQTERVFTNVSKGEFANVKDLQKVFGTKDEKVIARTILQEGQLQVSDKERTQQLEKTTAQISEWISKNCVNPQSERPYTISQIRHAMTQAKFSVHPTKPLKRHYLDCVKLLQTVIPIQRAKMELSLLKIPKGGEAQAKVESTLKVHNVNFVANTQEPDATLSSVPMLQYRILVDPSLYRVLNDVIQHINEDGDSSSTVAKAKIEIVNQVVTKQGDYNLEDEVVSNSKELVAANAAKMVHNNTDEVDVVDTTELLNRSKVQIDDDEAASSSEQEETGQKSRRKTQKYAKKRNQKAQRRTTDDDTVGDVKEQSMGTEPQVASSRPTNPPMSIHEASSPNNLGNDPNSRKSCNTCGGSFENAAEFRAHFKSDWHRFNQKLKLQGASPISEQEFLLCDSDAIFLTGTGDNGSIL